METKTNSRTHHLNSYINHEVLEEIKEGLSNIQRILGDLMLKLDCFTTNQQVPDKARIVDNVMNIQEMKEIT